MSAAADRGRRTLACRASEREATASAADWAHLLGPLADVRVEYGGPGSTDACPYAVTANKAEKRVAS